MFRFRRISAPRSKLTPFVLAASAAGLPLACMDDTARIVAPSDSIAGSQGTVKEPGTGATPPGAGESSAATGASGGGDDATPSSASAAQTGNTAVPQGEPPAEGCWQLPVVNRARLLAPSGQAAALVGGKIVGSRSSPTNGFVDLAEITQAPADGEWLDIGVANETAYRYVKYYGPGGSHGALAELELLSGDQRLEGASFGSAGSLDDSGTVFENALDGDPSTFFEGPLPNDNYVGLDLGAGHELGAPTFSPAAGTAAAGDVISLSAGPDASVWYTVDGSDPATNGVPYAAPLTLSPGTTLIKAVAVGHCALPSPVATATFSTGEPTGGGPSGGAPNPVQSSMHIGNSLTDTINDLLPTIAADGGIALDYNRYTIPGAGTWLYDTNPTGGFGVANVQETLRTRPFDHLSMQPFPNQPCQPTPSADGDDSDSGFVAQAWSDAMTQNPDVQLWVYQQWPQPADFVNCMSGGGWTRGDWAPPEPTSWESAVANELAYQEAVRTELIALYPDAPPPYIVPGGLALLALKQAVDAGEVPGMSDFFGTFFLDGGADIHLTAPGAYLISLVFYSCLFQTDPAGLGNDSGGVLSDEQAAAFQRIAWDTVQTYPLSGLDR